MQITIITVGGKSHPEIAALIDNYSKRLPKNITVMWRYLKNGEGNAESSKQQESENILKAIPEKSFIILLDETGSQINNQKLSEKLFSAQKDVTIIIGGAYGVSKNVARKADLVWSLSSLVFPHQIVRLLLAEQIYRSYAIYTNHPYHHS